MSPLHVAVVTETFPPEVNGVAMTIGRMVAGLVARGHRVSLVRPRQSASDSREADCGLETMLVRGLPIPGYPMLKFGIPAPIALRRKWRDDRPDVVQIVTEGPLGASALSAARALDIPVVTEFHTNFDSYSRHYGLGWLELFVRRHLRRLHNRGDLTLVPSHQLASDLAINGYRNVRLVARGVDTALFNPARRNQALRTEWGVAPDQLVVLHVGRLAPEKNLRLVFSAFKTIRQFVPDARLVLVGDGPARRHLEAAHPGHIFAGMRHGEDLAAHYASGDLFLFPSLTETYGNVVLEAMASGLPVVSFRLAAAAELIRHGHSGMLAPAGDNAAFTRGALDVATHPELRRQLASRAADAVSKHAWERIVEHLEVVLREGIQRRVRGATKRTRLGIVTD